MERSRIMLIPVLAVFLMICFSMNSWAYDKIAVMEYSLKPIESLESGRLIKTRWTAKLRNRVSEPVSFSITIIFVGRNNEELKQAKVLGELKALETKTFSDTVTLETALANRIASTRVSIDDASTPPARP